MRHLAAFVCLALAGPALAQGEHQGLSQAVNPGGAVAPTTTSAVPSHTLVVRKPKQRAEASVVIEASPAAVWDYLSDNSKAEEWSVYFHHIATLDAAAQTRRCFMNADESGKRWDERVVGIALHRVRHIDMYNMTEYGVPGVQNHHYDVYQLYERLGPNRTKLTFRTAPAKGASFGQHLLWAAARRKTAKIFAQNLVNIKAAIEQGADYQRRYPYPYSD